MYVNVLKEISVEMSSDEEDVSETTKTKDKGCGYKNTGKKEREVADDHLLSKLAGMLAEEKSCLHLSQGIRRSMYALLIMNLLENHLSGKEGSTNSRRS